MEVWIPCRRKAPGKMISRSYLVAKQLARQHGTRITAFRWMTRSPNVDNIHVVCKGSQCVWPIVSPRWVGVTPGAIDVGIDNGIEIAADERWKCKIDWRKDGIKKLKTLVFLIWAVNIEKRPKQKKSRSNRPKNKKKVYNTPTPV